MIRIPVRLSHLVALLFLFAIAHHAHAQILFPAVGGSPRTDGGKVVGISLNSHGQTITSLGFYDHGGDGIAGNYQIGLWDSSNTLVRSATITPASPLTGDFRYASIAPITLGTFPSPSETFTMGVLLPPNPPDIWLDNALLVLSVGFTGAGTGRESGPSGSLVYPANIGSSPYYVVNANGPAPPFVPEPASVAMFSLAAFACASTRRRVR